jgi:ABC-type sugar transport system permease subunit
MGLTVRVVERSEHAKSAFTRSRLALAFAAAATLCLVLASHVYVQFDAVRFKVADAPIASVDGRAVVPLDPSLALDTLRAPFAVIARIQNGAADAHAFTIEIDDRAVCQPVIASGGPHRVDCRWRGAWAGGSHQIVVTGPASPWTLTYLELATHHGATRSHSLVILPAGSHQYVAPDARGILAAGILLTLLLFVPAPPIARRWLRHLHRGLAAFAILLLALTALSSLVSRFDLVLSLPAFVEVAAVLLAPRLWAVGLAFERWRHDAPWKPAMVAALVMLIVLATYARLVQRQARDVYQGNYSGFLHVSTRRFNADPMLKHRDDIRQALILEDGGGYDAQFMYLESFDPLLRQYQHHPQTYRRFIDNPPYRYGRIGFAWLTKAFSGDRWQRYPATMMGLILASLCLAGLLLAWIARTAGGSPWWGLLILLVPGFWPSVQFGLPEPIAAATLLGAYLCCLRGRYVWAGALLAISLLIRETGVIFVLAIAVATLMSGKRRQAIVLVTVALVPVIVWRLYVGWILWPDWGLRGILLHTNDFAAPFVGIGHLWAKIAQGVYASDISSMARSGIWFPLLLTAGTGLAAAFAIFRPGPAGLAAVCYGAMALSFNYVKVWLAVGNAERVTFELFIMLAILSVGAAACPRRLRHAVTLFWVGAAIYVLYGATSADYLRQAIFGQGF